MGRGRNRDERLDAEVFDAARTTLSSKGYERFSIDAVAVIAGVPKSTVYRRWPSRTALLVAVLADWYRTHAMTEPTGSPIRDDLMFLVRQEVEVMSTPEGRAVAQAAIASLDNADGDLAPVTDLIRQRRHLYEDLMSRAAEAGSLPSNTDVRLSVDLMIGAVWSASISGDVVVSSLAARVVDTVLADPPRHP